jgi:hypothetical protein
VDLGHGVVVASPERVMDALDAFDPDGPWTSVAPLLLPVLPRRRPYPGGIDEPVEWESPLGLRSRFGVDLGPAFAIVSQVLVERWGVTLDEIAERSLANVRVRAGARQRHALIAESVADVPTRVFQSREGWASALLLIPEELTRRFGEDPQLLIAPCRDVLVSMPFDTDREFALWLMDEFAAIDPNALDLPLFSLVGGELRIEPSLEAPAVGRLH